MSEPRKLDPDATQHIERYSEHARRLQTWIGAYGAGLATLLVYQFRTVTADIAQKYATHVANASIAEELATHDIAERREELNFALTLIAIALGIQVLLLVLNKCTQFALGNNPMRSQSYLASQWFAKHYTIDFVIDAAAIVLLAFATLHGLQAIGIQ